MKVILMLLVGTALLAGCANPGDYIGEQEQDALDRGCIYEQGTYCPVVMHVEGYGECTFVRYHAVRAAGGLALVGCKEAT